jgi:hypothetical protein
MPKTPALRDIALRELTLAASAIAGFTFAKAEYGSAANVSGLRTKTLTFSSRHDSRTQFASDNRYGHLRKAGAWKGDDKTAVAACRRVLRGAKIPANEIAGIDVLSEMGQVAERASDGKIQVREPTLLRKLARARRGVAGIRVWSSYATVGLNSKGEIGWLEVHWPEVPAVVVKEAVFLQMLIKRGFNPRELPGARPEAVEVGVIHSPAVGFFMDVIAAVRVIYAGHEPNVGRKATLYFDRHGDLVPLPREINPAKPEPAERPKPR